MATFFEDLWSSIFTPGPTPTLLVATNITFAALQVLLFILLIVTYSVHFFVLSFLSGALWWSINWFANEIRMQQAHEEAKEKQKAKSPGKSKQKGDPMKTPWAVDNTESDTETECLTESPRFKVVAVDSTIKSTGTEALGVETFATQSDEAMKKRRSGVGGESSGYTSTDSEWEKVDNNGKNG